MRASIGVDLHSLPTELRGLVQNELDRGEEVVWVDQPDPRAAGKGYLAVQLFAIPWTLFAVFWICGAAGFKVPDFNKGFDLFPLFGIPFVLVGIGMLSAPIWAKKMARKSVYVLTNRRALVFKKQFSSMSIRSFDPDQLHDLERNQRPDGTGDLIFKREVTGHGDNGPNIGSVGFMAIANVKQVEDLVETLVKNSKSD